MATNKFFQEIKNDMSNRAYEMLVEGNDNFLYGFESEKYAVDVYVEVKNGEFEIGKVEINMGEVSNDRLANVIGQLEECLPCYQDLEAEYEERLHPYTYWY